jgi:CRISP-associated protein Cas1
MPYQARSVWLSSERLGITAKIDIVEGDASGRVIPIEYKRGRAPDLPEGAYLPERAQLCAHVLLLREHGYSCGESAIYFAATRRRVPIAIDDALIATTLAAAARARELARRWSRRRRRISWGPPSRRRSRFVSPWKGSV